MMEADELNTSTPVRPHIPTPWDAEDAFSTSTYAKKLKKHRRYPLHPALQGAFMPDSSSSGTGVFPKSTACE
jgi:hypothetical protein